MADQYYKRDTLKLCYIVGSVSVVLCIAVQYSLVSGLIQRDSFTNRTDSSSGPWQLLVILITAIASFVISSIISSKGDAVIAFVLRIILIISFIISFLLIAPRCGSVA
jgi:hypothetical protein